MLAQDMREFQVGMLQELCPPFAAVGLGGSVGARQNDADSDLDFFLLAPAEEFLSLVESFPRMVRHPSPPVVCRRRGFHAEFGYMYTYVYSNRCHVDYSINCSGTLARTPMAAKTHVLKDLTGEFTAYHEQMRDLARDFPAGEALDGAAAEVLVELVRIEAYTRRGELLSVLHRFERLRLVLLGLERHIRGIGPYTPHDADKWVARDLPEMLETVAATCPTFDWSGAARAFDVLQAAVCRRLAALGTVGGLRPAYRTILDEVVTDVRSAMQENVRSSAPRA